MAKRRTPARSRGAGRKKRSRKAQIQFVANRLLGIEPDSAYQTLNSILKEVYSDMIANELNRSSAYSAFLKKELSCPNETNTTSS